MLGPDDPLPGPPQRIAVAGVSGAGKSTLARQLSQRLDLPYTETDALHRGPGWTPRPEFLADVEALVAGPRWITDWQYAVARPLITARADLLVWLDPPTGLVMRQVVARTVRRRLGRVELWNGNREPPLWTILTHDDHIVRWAWRTRHRLGEQVPDVAAAHPDLTVLRLRSHAETAAWLARLDPSPG